MENNVEGKEMSKKKEPVEKSPWGEVIYVDEGEAEEEDEIQRLIQKVRILKKQKLPDGVPLKEARKRKQEEINKLEKEIYDLIKLKKQKTMFG